MSRPIGTESEGMDFREGDVTGLSRRQLFRRGGLALTGVTGACLVDATSAFAKPPGRKPPVPAANSGGFDESFNLVSDDAAFHFFPPGIGFDMSTITDFNGIVGGSEIRGTAHGKDGTTTTSIPICGSCAACTSDSTGAYTPGRSVSYELTCSIRAPSATRPVNGTTGSRA